MESNRACQTCKARRIKCDGAKPICMKCAKSQRPCVEARVSKQEYFSIHVENDYASGKKRRPRGPRSTLIPIGPDFDLEARATAYYVQNHFQVFQDVPDVVATWTESFHEWKTSGRTSLIVDLAFSSLALSVFGRCMNCPPAENEGVKSYHNLLQTMRSKLWQIRTRAISAEEIDAFFLTTYFMARYESYCQRHDIAEESISPVRVWSHIDGAGAILKLWYDNRTNYEPSTTVKLARRTLIKSSLLRGQQLPRWLQDGSSFGEEGLASEFDRVNVHLMNIYHRYSKTGQDSDGCQRVVAELTQLSSETRQLAVDVQKWSKRFPSKWSYFEYVVPDDRKNLDGYMYQATVLGCAKPGYAAVWNEYFALQTCIANTQVQILTALEQLTNLSNEPRIAECKDQLKTASEQLAALLPYGLGRIRFPSHDHSTSDRLAEPPVVSQEPLQPYLANFTMWPLAMVSTMQYLDPEMKQWFRSRIYQIGDSLNECSISYVLSDYWNITSSAS